MEGIEETQREQERTTHLKCNSCGSLVEHQNLHLFNANLCCHCLDINEKIKCVCEREADKTDEKLQNNKRCITKLYNEKHYSMRIQGEQHIEIPITNEDIINENMKLKDELKKIKKTLSFITEQMGILRYADSE